MTDITVDLQPGNIVLGKENNKVSITVTAAKDLAGVRATITIPFGPKAGQTCLIAQNSSVTLRIVEGPGKGQDLSPSPEPLDGCKEWQTDPETLSADKSFTIEITDLTPVPGPGDASLTVRVSANRSELYNQTLKIAVEAGGFYFDAFPDYLLHGGDPATVAWYCPKPMPEPVLYKNNVNISLKDGETFHRYEDKEGVGGVFLDRPMFTSVYRLQDGARIVSDGHNKPPLGIRTVQVAQAGWNQQDLPQGYPGLLVVRTDGIGNPDRLYGIFIDRDQKASLFSSATGLTDWQQECSKEQFPQEMKYSPGVVFRNELWLIGGSSMESNIQVESDLINRFDFNERTWSGPSIASFPKRCCHACVATRDEIFVLGGFSQGKSILDVSCWNGVRWAKLECKSQWTGRCLFAAAAIEISGDAKELWIYGGIDNPVNTAAMPGELWSTPLPVKDNQCKWTRRADLELPPAIGNPLGAAMLYIPGPAGAKGPAAISQLQGSSRFAGNLILAGSFRLKASDKDVSVVSQYIFRLNRLYKTWENNPVSFGWEQFPGAPFLLRSVSFNGFWFFWSLHDKVAKLKPEDWEARRPKLNIFIPS